MIKTLRLSEALFILFPRRIWNFVRYFVYPSYGEQRARLVRMTVLVRYFVYPSYGEQRARFVRMTVLVESNVRDSSG